MREPPEDRRAAAVMDRAASAVDGFQAYVASRRATGHPVILDLGCGQRKAPGAFGIDIVPLPAIDMVHDLQTIPYPLPDGCADEIRLEHVLEHLASPLPILREVWRLARHGGQVFIRTPHYSGCYAWKDPTHQRAFSAESFHYFGENGYSYYTDARFHVREARLKYFLEEQYWPRPHRAWGRLVQRMLDSHPTFAERFLCYWIGGIDEIQVRLEAVKTENVQNDQQTDGGAL